MSDASTEISNDEFAAATSPPDCRGRINLRCDSRMEQEINSIAEDSRYPLNSVSEVVRFCCLTGLPKLRSWKPGNTLLGAMRSANAMMLRDKLQCESLDLLQRLDERVEWYIANGFSDEVITIIAEVKSYFEAAPDDFWSDYIKKAIDERFAGWCDRIDTMRKR